MFDAVNVHLGARHLLLRQGTIVDATIIHAPSSTKNSSGTRDPQMHQTRKGNQWFFGLKAHIGVDRDSGLVHTVVTTAANVADVTQTHALLHGKETMVLGDAGYTGAAKRQELQGKRIDWQIAERRHTVKALPEGALKLALAANISVNRTLTRCAGSRRLPQTLASAPKLLAS